MLLVAQHHFYGLGVPVVNYLRVQPHVTVFAKVLEVLIKDPLSRLNFMRIVFFIGGRYFSGDVIV